MTGQGRSRIHSHQWLLTDLAKVDREEDLGRVCAMCDNNGLLDEHETDNNNDGADTQETDRHVVYK